MNNTTEPNQAGLDAIAAKAKQLYPNQKGMYYGTIIPYGMGGNDPLDGVEIWQSEHGVPHWHYITYGFTELYEKESDITEESGFGFELSFRLKRDGEDQPPIWPINLLQNLARYVFSTGNVFGPGHHMSCNGPIALETDTKLTALGFRIDPELGEMDTPNGHMIFLQAAAITEDEMNAMMCWDGTRFLDALDQQLPLCITDLARSSQMDVPAFYSVWKKGMEKDGSSTGFLYMDELGAELTKGQMRLRLGAGHYQELNNMLNARVGKGRELFFQGQNAAVLFRAGEFSLGREEDLLCVALSEKALAELCEALTLHVGEHPLPSFPALVVTLVPTTITDPDGNVLQVIE